MGNVVGLKMLAAGEEQENPDVPTITFETFWRAWPKNRRLCKKQAFYQWKLVNPIWYPKIIEAVLLFRETQQWKESNGAFVPYPFRWLRDERWTDELETDLTMGQCMWNQNGNREEGKPRCPESASVEKRGLNYCKTHSERA